MHLGTMKIRMSLGVDFIAVFCDSIGITKQRMFTNMARKKNIKEPDFFVIDFFSGAGGTTRGLIDAGGYVLAGVDIDPACRDTYVKNNKNQFLDKKYPKYLERDIFAQTEYYEEGEQHLLFEELEELISAKRAEMPEVPFLFAICAPCQPFTKFSGKLHTDERKEKRSRDRNLLTEACKFVDYFKPEMVLSENVSGIRNARYGNVWDHFKTGLADMGYATGTEIVCVSKFGVPQYRKRSILIGIKEGYVREDRYTDGLKTELLVPKSDPDAVMVSAKKALEHLPPLKAGEAHPEIPNHRTRNLSDLNIRRISCAPPGESNAYLENTKYGDLSLPCHRRVNKRLKSRCYGDVYTRMHSDRPSPTITTKCHSISNGRYGHWDLKQNRGISLREAAILQSFPDNYVFYPEDQIGSVGRMIGNAVPPKLSEFYGRYLYKSLEEQKLC